MQSDKPSLGDLSDPATTRVYSPERSDLATYEPIFSLDNFGWVIATLPDRGKLKSQSVESHLLLAILKHLRGERQGR